MRNFFLLFLFALLHVEVSPAAPRVVAVTIDDVIHPITVEIVTRAIVQAEAQKASLVLIRLYTPGGLMEAMRGSVERIIASPVPVATYVAPAGARAASAGFFILMAGDVAAMAPGTNTGAASPVALGGEMDETTRKKVESDAAALLRSITEPRGRNVKLAESTVFEARSFTAGEALKNNLIEVIAADDRDLLSQLDGREVIRYDGRRQTLQVAGAEIVEYRQTLRERLISAVSNPNLAFILLVLGALGLYIEFSNPGLIFPGVAGGILFLLGLSALAVLPINWVGVALLVLAVTLFVMEAFFTSYGVLGIGGAVAMVLGAVLLIEGPPEVRIDLAIAIAVALPFALITIFLLSLVVKSYRQKVTTGNTGMLGQVGVAYTALAPEGKVLIRGEYWDASSSTPVAAGSRVRVVSVDGLTLRVEPIP